MHTRILKPTVHTHNIRTYNNNLLANKRNRGRKVRTHEYPSGDKTGAEGGNTVKATHNKRASYLTRNRTSQRELKYKKRRNYVSLNIISTEHTKLTFSTVRVHMVI